MDRRERIYDPEETLRIAMESAQAKIWTSLPGIIESFDPVKMTCNVKPAMTCLVRRVEGFYDEVPIPLLLDCPVVFPGGGGITMTFPIVNGDECLVTFASRCIDSWWQLGGVQGQAEFRMHDLSDGFVIPGVRSQPRKFTVSTTAAQMRTDDGTMYLEFNPTTKAINGKAVTFNLEASTSITLKAPTVAIQGNETVTGTVVAQGDVTGQGTSLHNHTHSGVMVGFGNTGVPN